MTTATTKMPNAHNDEWTHTRTNINTTATTTST